jgi:hypothetical protein
MTINLEIMKNRIYERKSKHSLLGIIMTLSFLVLGGNSFAQEQEIDVTPEDLKLEKDYSPYAGNSYPNKVLFGDTHLHTKYSPDAGMVGTTLDVDDAYRFASGETVEGNSGQRVQLVRPLDFLVVTDHAEYIGLAPMIRDSDPVLLADPYGKWLHDKFRTGNEDDLMEAFKSMLNDAATGNSQFSSDEATRSIWNKFVHTAEKYNTPGKFTALTGFEWTSMPDGNNLHRVVVFADDVDKTSQILPYTVFDSSDPEDLWDYMEMYEEKTGGTALAIPHNGNVSNGLMFSDKDAKGNKLTKEYAMRRMRWEPIIEVTQMKGDGETHPFLSPDDEFADYETWAVSNLTGTTPKEDWMLQYEYGRSALKLGLKLGAETGANPFKFGLSGATDSHTGLATSREENYFGKYAKTEPKAKRHDYEVIPAVNPDLRIMTSQELAAGLTAVWSRENTRQDIVNGMKRKEVYATTGTRMRVRLFAGWDFEADEVVRPDFAKQGYLRGVPMGGNLSNGSSGQSPKFMVRALRDPDGANLDRIQIIKGWLDSKGETHEKIYDVAVTDGRKIGKDGRCKDPVGSTVDIEKATYTNTIGEAVLTAYWEDPDFDAKQEAFYYVRVLEIPTPRWTTYDAAYYGVKRPDRVPATTQDRAYTSPVWYSPGK